MNDVLKSKIEYAVTRAIIAYDFSDISITDDTTYIAFDVKDPDDAGSFYLTSVCMSLVPLIPKEKAIVMQTGFFTYWSYSGGNDNDIDNVFDLSIGDGVSDYIKLTEEEANVLTEQFPPGSYISKFVETCIKASNM